jgi:DNA-directed RNA polymerase beta' subunit
MTLHRMVSAAAPADCSIGSFASFTPDDDIADEIEALARLVARRRERLEHLRQLHAPPVVLRNERRMVRDAVNALCAAATSRPRLRPGA